MSKFLSSSELRRLFKLWITTLIFEAIPMPKQGLGFPSSWLPPPFSLTSKSNLLFIYSNSLTWNSFTSLALISSIIIRKAVSSQLYILCQVSNGTLLVFTVLIQEIWIHCFRRDRLHFGRRILLHPLLQIREVHGGRAPENLSWHQEAWKGGQANHRPRRCQNTRGTHGASRACC